MASVLEGDVNRVLHTLQKLVSEETGPLPKPLPRLRDLDAIVSRVLAPKSSSVLDRCKPWDYDAFLSRARTFKAMLWFAKPEALNPLRCARFGWQCKSRDTLFCPVCSAEVTVKELLEGDPEKMLNEAHKDTCPWREDPCPLSFLDFQYLSDADCVRQLKGRMAGFEAVLPSKITEAHVVARPDSIVRVVMETLEAQIVAAKETIVEESVSAEDMSLDDFLIDDKEDEATTQLGVIPPYRTTSGNVASERDFMSLFFHRVQAASALQEWGPDMEIAAVFAVFGWSVVRDEGQAGPGLSPSNEAVLVLTCDICGGVARLRSSEHSAQQEGSRAAKRKKYPRVHPETSHRVWCPVVHTESKKPPGFVYSVGAILNSAASQELEEQQDPRNTGDREGDSRQATQSKKNSPASKLADTYRRIREMLDET